MTETEIRDILEVNKWQKWQKARYIEKRKGNRSNVCFIVIQWVGNALGKGQIDDGDIR